MKLVSSAVCAALALLNASTSVEALHIMRRMEAGAGKGSADKELPNAAKLRAEAGQNSPRSPRTPTGPTATAAIEVDDEDEEAMLAAAIALSKQGMDVSAPATPTAASAASVAMELEPPAPVAEMKAEPTFKEWYDAHGDGFRAKYADKPGVGQDWQHGTSKCAYKSFLNAVEQLKSEKAKGEKAKELPMGEAAANIKLTERLARRCSNCGMSYSKDWLRQCEKTVAQGGLACGKSGMTSSATVALNGLKPVVACKMGGERI